MRNLRDGIGKGVRCGIMAVGLRAAIFGHMIANNAIVIVLWNPSDGLSDFLPSWNYEWILIPAIIGAIVSLYLSYEKLRGR